MFYRLLFRKSRKSLQISLKPNLMALNKSVLKELLVLGTIALIGLLVFWELKGFLNAALGASVLYIVLRKAQFFLQEKKKWPATVSAVLLLLLSFTVMVLPFILVTWMLTTRLGYLESHYEEWLQLLEQWLTDLYARTGLEWSDSVGSLGGVAEKVFGALPGLIMATAGLFTGLLVSYFVLYYMLTNGRALETRVYAWLPFKPENKNILKEELKQMTMMNAVGAPLLAMVQGLLSWLGYSIAGLEDAFFWAVITGVLSFLPLLGTLIAWLPIAMVMILQNPDWHGYFLLLYGVIVISNADNLFRLWLQKQMGDVHPLITFFGIFIGLDLFGITGLIFGPLLISYLILLIKIYQKEYLS